MGKKIEKTPRKIDLEFMARKWWFYLLLLILYFIPPYASKSYNSAETQYVVFEVLKYSLKPYEWLAPLFHIATIVLVICLPFLGDRITRIFSVYVSINFFFIAFAQSIAVTEKYGLGILIGGIICFSIVGIFWIWEAIVKKNDFTPHRIPAWKYWVVPLAVLAFWAPLKPDFNPVYLLTSYYGLAFCLTTPVILAILTFYHPRVNISTLRVTSFMGILLGILNISVIFMGANVWISGVLHLPLLTISVYSFTLSLKRRERV